MRKWMLAAFALLHTVSVFANNELELDIFNSRNNPTNIRYYVDHYQHKDSQEYQYLLISVRAAANALDSYTGALEGSNKSVAYCLPKTERGTIKNLSYWTTEELMTMINEQIDYDRQHREFIKKNGNAGFGGGIGSYLRISLKHQFPCPAHKQLQL